MMVSLNKSPKFTHSDWLLFRENHVEKFRGIKMSKYIIFLCEYVPSGEDRRVT